MWFNQSACHDSLFLFCRCPSESIMENLPELDAGGRGRHEAAFKWRRFKEQHILIYGPLNEVARTFRFCTNFEYFSLYIDTFIIYLFIFLKKWCVYVQVPYTSPVEEINSKLCFDKLLYM